MRKNGLPETRILVKREPELAWPADSTFYVLSRDGVFICRNHEFFRSCAPARGFPSELAEQGRFLQPRYPKLSRRAFERVVGFFARIGAEHNAEAAVLLAWDRRRRRVRLIVPEQVATVGKSWSGTNYPIGLRYERPKDLAPDEFVFGDIHSHVNLAAYASGTDVADEEHLPGLHIVVGRIDEEPPQIHVEAVVDGTRFRLGPEETIGGYRKRCLDVPQAWIDRVKIEESSFSWYFPSSSAGSNDTFRGQDGAK